LDQALHIIDTHLLADYVSRLDASLARYFGSLHGNLPGDDAFGLHNSVSAVYSARIEGERVELADFIEQKREGYQPDPTRKIDDLYDAYVYAEQTRLTPHALVQAHAIIIRNLLPDERQTAYRTGTMQIFGNGGLLEYEALAPERIAAEMNRLFHDLELLLTMELAFGEVLYMASMLHLALVKIHPFDDGNARTARLLEKWFIAQKLGAAAWLLEPERFYYHQRTLYYDCMRRPGLRYDEVDYTKAGSFLQLLPDAIGAQIHSE